MLTANPGDSRLRAAGHDLRRTRAATVDRRKAARKMPQATDAASGIAPPSVDERQRIKPPRFPSLRTTPHPRRL